MKIKRIIAAAVFVCLLGGMMTSVGHFWRPAEMDTDNLNYLYKEDKDELEKYTKVLYAQARLIEGLPIDNPTEVTNLICEIMS